MRRENFRREDFLFRLRCSVCGHVQEVLPATVVRDDAGDLHVYYGSAYDFCNKCDGHLIEEGLVNES